MCYIFFNGALSGAKKESEFSPINFYSKIRYQIRGKPDFDSVITKDLSGGGLRFINDSFLPTATPIMLEIYVANRVLRPIGRVAWSTSLPHSNRNQTGVEFIEFNMLERSYLEDFVNMQLGSTIT